MDSVTSQYFAGLETFDEAVRRRDYGLAAQLLKATLPHVEGAMRSMQRDFGIPPSIPILDAKGIAIAALYPDAEVDVAFERFATSALLGHRVEAGVVPAAREVADEIKAALQEAGGLDRAGLRKRVRSADGRMFAQMLTYLIKAETVTELEGHYSLGAPDEIPAHRPEDTFRIGQEAATYSVPDLTTLPRLEGKPKHEQPPAWRTEDAWAPLAIESQAAERAVGVVFGPDGLIPLERTPKELRPEGKPQTVVLRDSTWLLSYKRPASAKKPIWTAAILDLDGKEVRRLSIPGNITRTYSWPNRAWISVLCDDQVVYVYRSDGEILDIISLHENPDISVAARAIERDASEMYWLRAFDYDPLTRSVLFSYFDRLVVAERDGTVRWAIQPPGDAEHTEAWPPGPIPDVVNDAAVELGLRSGLSLREVASWLHVHGHKKPKRERELSFTITWGTGRALSAGRKQKTPLQTVRAAVGDLVFDTVKYARFTDGGVSVSTESGLNILIDEDSGALLRAWQTPAEFNVMSMCDGFDVGLSGLWVTQCALNVVVLGGTGVADPVQTRFRHNGPRLAGRGWLALWDGKALRVLSGSGIRDDRTYLLPKPLTAIYPEHGLLRVHLGIDSFLIDVSNAG